MNQDARTDGLRTESFQVEGAEGTLDPRGAEFIRALDYGFLDAPRSDEHLIGQLDRFRVDGTTLTGVYDDAQDPRSVGSERPVATFGDFVGSLCVDAGVVIPAQMITEVSVRGTHRRRGILSGLMTSALQRGRDAGFALAALTASEGGIYGRFGFAPAAFSQRITVKVTHGLRLRTDVRTAVEAAGLRVIVPTWEAYAEAYPTLQEAVQAQRPGQIGHTHAYRRRAAGVPDAWAIAHMAEPDLRPMLVVDGTSAARGYVLARFGGADRKPAALRIRDLGALDTLAELALWEALGATDLIDELVWSQAAVDTALPAALANPRDVVFGDRADHLWLRILDVPATFTARGLRADGAIVLDVTDRLGHAAGRWLIERTNGVTTAHEADTTTAPTLRVDVETLGTLVLGTVPVAALVATGRASAGPTDIPALAAALDTDRAPLNVYGF